MDQTSIYICLVWIALALAKPQESEDAKTRCASFFQGMAIRVAAFSNVKSWGRILEFINLHLSNKIRLHFWFGFNGLTKLRYGW